MADGGRTCTECGTPVTGRKITCSNRCRSARSARVRKARARADQGHPTPHLDPDSSAEKILERELTPVIREALTEDVLAGVRSLVEHIPTAVARLVTDLDSTDENVRQRAYMELLKRTVGNQQIVPDVNAEAQRDLQVFFNLPRPEQVAALPGESEVIEAKTCDSCGEYKTITQFVGSSDRCRECFESMQQTARRFASDSPV